VKRLDRRLSLPHGPFTGSDEDGGDQRTSQRAQRATRQSARARAMRAAVRASEGALRSAGATSATAR
jgi:hypothetical protein